MQNTTSDGMGTTAWAPVALTYAETEHGPITAIVEGHAVLEALTDRSAAPDRIECPACEGSGAKGFRHGYDGSGVAYGDVDDCPSCNGSGDALCDVCCKEHAVAEERDGSLTLLVCEGCRAKEEAPRPIVKTRFPVCNVGVPTDGGWLITCACGEASALLVDGRAMVDVDYRCSKCSGGEAVAS